MVARAKPDPLQHRAQSRGRPNHAILEQVHVRQMPRPWQMPAAGTIARVLASELRARTALHATSRRLASGLRSMLPLRPHTLT
jgi:hypothetical protein